MYSYFYTNIKILDFSNYFPFYRFCPLSLPPSRKATERQESFKGQRLLALKKTPAKILNSFKIFADIL
ncbi:MAG: hypothetical protein A2908_02645 [Candidatus Staskawiczbacteria bacterium RIFCSPLOWO2_01_FULL_38_12b]|uniref:Uncharacterized protein n=1 Tax=Candidatus Staskawiczbacteria bacterium RIFCSPLOWO2_01_FULL_38_12b TaxID=1802214 RepID=A0A1G2IB00_9BACT|nr:MAG: hypothetical protein A2908_02645 [Candidatus Staskawiczbacteria bacterium RIFCSPLOWO2_01_FULL_38_12b]